MNHFPLSLANYPLSIHCAQEPELLLSESSKLGTCPFNLAERVNKEKVALQNLKLSKEDLIKLAPGLNFVDCRNLFLGWENEEILQFLRTCSNNVKTFILDAANLKELPPLPNCENLDCSGCRSLLLLPSIPKCKTLNFAGCTLLQRSYCGFSADIVLDCINSLLIKEEIDEIDDINLLGLLLNLQKISLNDLLLKLSEFLKLAPLLTFLNWKNAFNNWPVDEVEDFLNLCERNITFLPSASFLQIVNAQEKNLKSSIPEFITNYLDNTVGIQPQERLQAFQSFLIRHDGNAELKKLSSLIELTFLSLKADLPNTSLAHIQESLMFFKLALPENNNAPTLPKIKKLEEKIVTILQAAKEEVEKYFHSLNRAISQNLLPKNVLNQLLNATVVRIDDLKKAGIRRNLIDQMMQQVGELQESINQIAPNLYLTSSRLKSASSQLKSGMSKDDLDARLLEGEQIKRIPEKLQKELLSLQDELDKIKHTDEEFEGFLQERIDEGEPVTLDQDTIEFVDLQSIKKSFPKESLDGSLCIAHVQGNRPTQEDTHLATVMHINFGKKIIEVPLYAIFDGHGGLDGSKFLSEKLERKLKFELESALKFVNRSNQQDVEAAIFNTLKTIFHKLTKEYLLLNSKKGGSTACIALVFDRNLWTANLGDSRAILSVNGLPIVLSRDGGLDTQEQIRTIEKRGGQVTDCGNQYYTEMRVNRNLNMSRSACEVVHPLNTRSKITCFPIDLLPPGIKTLCIACDGAFDALSSRYVAEILYKNIQIEVGSLNLAARSLIADAYNKGSGDNISTLLLDLNYPFMCGKINKSEEEKEQKS